VIRHNTGRHEKDLRTDNPQGTIAREIRCHDDRDEAAVVAREVLAWIDRRRAPSDIAVFVRTNAQSRGIEGALRDRGIPYRIVGAVEFYKRAEVKDLLAYARIARNPRDETALRRVLNVPARGIGKKSEERLVAAARERGVPIRELLRSGDGLSGLGRARPALEIFSRLLARIETLPAEDPALFLSGVIGATEYRAHLGEHGGSPEVERLQNVDELVSAAAEYALRESQGGIDGFLEENALVSDQDALADAGGAVVIMTVHAAKGLEFPCVCVAGLEEGLFPLLMRTGDADVEEERRLFYVAVTRAMEELVLLHGQRRMRQGQILPSLPSRFLDEIPDELLSVEDRVTGTHVFEDEPVFDVDEGGAGGLQAGDRVRHPHFGDGRVLAVRPAGGSTRITVEFRDAGRRELAAGYARLERL
jgi:DNA helicase-2/ATP-dependent DNA helicase PcrA